MLVPNLTVPTVCGEPSFTDYSNDDLVKHCVACGLSYSDYLDHAEEPVPFGVYIRAGHEFEKRMDEYFAEMRNPNPTYIPF